jgi:uncharacterized membrane protein YdjX (TVP38/TMEM64 family)
MRLKVNQCCSKPFEYKYWLPRILVLCVIIVVVALVVTYKDLILEVVATLLTWVQEHNTSGPFIILILTCCTVVCMGPYSVFALGSGYAFSHAFDHIAKVLAVGTACVFIGAWCGANIAFVLGRFCCRKRVLKFAEKKPILRAIDKVVLKEGLKLIILMRMSLLIPFNFSNYIFGCSAIKYWQFALGTLGVLPLVCFLVYMGTTFSNL